MTRLALNDVCLNICDGVHNTVIDTPNERYYLLSAKNIKDGSILVSSDERTISLETFEKLRRRTKLSKGDVVITTVGTIGEVALIPDNNINYEFQRSVGILKPNPKIINARFLKYVMQSSSMRTYLLNNATGAAQPCLFIGFLKKVKIEFPALSLQETIASILSAYDDLIEKNNRKIAILQQMAEELYKEWFVRFRFPGYKTAKFKDGIPEGWQYVKLENIANISTGKCNREDAEEDGVYPLFDRSQEIRRSNSWLKDCEAIIVPGEGTSFIPRYYKGKFNLHQRCYCVEPKQGNIGFFLFQTLMMHRIYFLYVATGATVPSLRQTNFNNFKVLMPNKDLYESYNRYSSNWYEAITVLEQQNENLKTQRDLLLPRLMSGRLQVKA